MPKNKAALALKQREWNLRWMRKNPKRVLLSAIRRKARAGGYAFDLTIQDLDDIPSVCPALGVRLQALGSAIGSGRRMQEDSLSVDRVDPSRGYVRGNVRFISQRANRIKNDASADELEKIAAYIRQHEANTNG